uniref:NADH-ubiquinone oxidoreductase chain 6 n=1 Tax=Conaspidia wangi TaxID=2675281 RepID=A0A8E5BX31_9HYME|nr:NADH dehydrogenase subunit 6 [Conaspidia wangi]QSZ78260.1 NADH dehydrogenase subunit 6 [Conaspidia wangi]
MIKIILMLTFNNSMLFYFSSSPMPMGLILLIQTILITLISGFMSFSFWFSYILFLIMVGGMLILFIYVSSLSSNQKFSLKKNNIFFIIIISSFIIFLMINMQHLFFNYNNDLMPLNDMEMSKNFMLKMSLNKLYNYPTNYIMIMLINYLLLTLFIVVKITNINLGPLRKNS